MPSPHPAFLSPQPTFPSPRNFASTISPRRPRSRAQFTTMHFLHPAHSLPEVVNHILVSCGLGIAGIAGAKTTEQARALNTGDTQAERMEQAALEIDSVRRRRELSQVQGKVREWDDVRVDRFGGVRVWLEEVPEVVGGDELREFDRMLGEGEDK